MNRTASTTFAGGLIGLLGFLLGACATPGSDPGPAPLTAAPPLGEPVGELIESWAAQRTGEQWVGDIDPAVDLIVSPHELDRWIDRSGARSEALNALREVDLQSNALILARYESCAESSAVYAEPADAGEPVIVRFDIEPAEDMECEVPWETLDVWLVPHHQTGGDAPRALSTARATELSSPSPVGTLEHTVSEMEARASDLVDIVDLSGGLMSEPADRDAFADALEAALAPGNSLPDTLRSVDLDAHHLVVTGYHRCSETSRVMADTARDPALLWVEILTDDGVLCAWAPYTIDIWLVGHDVVSENVELGRYTAG